MKFNLPQKKSNNPKRSDTAKLVAIKTLENLGNGKILNKGKILRDFGYSESVIKNPKEVFETKSFKETIEPFIGKMLDQRNLAIERMGKTISKASYRDSVDAVDKLTKNIQLLQGKDTEKITGRIIMLPSRK